MALGRVFESLWTQVKHLTTISYLVRAMFSLFPPTNHHQSISFKNQRYPLVKQHVRPLKVLQNVKALVHQSFNISGINLQG